MAIRWFVGACLVFLILSRVLVFGQADSDLNAPPPVGDKEAAVERVPRA